MAEKDWSATAKDFNALQRYIVGEATLEQIKTKLAKLRDLGDVLELGCGNGNLTSTLAPESRHILATDVSREMLDIAERRLATFDNIDLQQADCYATGLAENSFDTVFMANLIHVVAKPGELLYEARRVLKPEGRLIIVSFTMDGVTLGNKLKLIYRYRKAFGKHPRQGTPFGLETLTEFVTGHGYQIEEATRLGDRQSQAMFVVAR